MDTLSRPPISVQKNRTTWLKVLVVGVRSFVVALFLFSLAGALHPDLRFALRSKVHNNFRKVLTVAEGSLAGSSKIKVYKVRSSQGMIIEVYDDTHPSIKPLLDRIVLPNEKDGFIVFQGQTTNLAVSDLDGDNSPEIIAPSFNKDLVARLNIYSIDPVTKKFHRIPTDQIRLPEIPK